MCIDNYGATEEERRSIEADPVLRDWSAEFRDQLREHSIRRERRESRILGVIIFSLLCFGVALFVLALR